MADVPPHRPRWAGDHRDRPWPCGQRPLPSRVEQPLLGEPCLERLEPQGEITDAGRLDRIHVELHGPGRLIEIDPTMDDDAETRLGREHRTLAVVAEPDALDLVALVLEREVGMTGGRHRDATDLALDPHVEESRILADRRADCPRDLADLEDLEPEGTGRGDARSHALLGTEAGLRYRSPPRPDRDGFFGVDRVPARQHPVRWRPVVALVLPIDHQTRVWYSPVRVSMRIVSPVSTKIGTCTTRPVSVVAGLRAPVCVSPAKPGSVSTTDRSTLTGNSTPMVSPS